MKIKTLELTGGCSHKLSSLLVYWARTERAEIVKFLDIQDTKLPLFESLERKPRIPDQNGRLKYFLSYCKKSRLHYFLFFFAY